MPAPLLETDDIEVIRTQFQAWMDGVNARFLGFKLSDIPHAARSAAGDAWANAWEICDRHLNVLGIDVDPEIDARLKVGDQVVVRDRFRGLTPRLLELGIVYRVKSVGLDPFTESGTRVALDGGHPSGYCSGWFEKVKQ